MASLGGSSVLTSRFSMQPGDIVKAKPDWAVTGVDYGYGVILDVYEDEDGIAYCEVSWNHEIQWWKPYELELISENR